MVGNPEGSHTEAFPNSLRFCLVDNKRHRSLDNGKQNFHSINRFIFLWSSERVSHAVTYIQLRAPGCYQTDAPHFCRHLLSDVWFFVERWKCICKGGPCDPVATGWASILSEWGDFQDSFRSTCWLSSLKPEAISFLSPRPPVNTHIAQKSNQVYIFFLYWKQWLAYNIVLSSYIRSKCL